MSCRVVTIGRMNLRELVRTRPAERATAIATSMSGVNPFNFSDTFRSYVEGGYKQNGVVWACVKARSWVFADVKYTFDRDGDLFDTPALATLLRPQPGVTHRTMMKRWEQDISFAGNAYLWRNGNQFNRLPPDLVDVLVVDDSLRGFVFWEGGRLSGKEPRVFGLDQVAHGMDTPDPTAPYKGMSWLQPVLTDIQSDGQMTKHKSKFFKNAATPNLLVTVEKKIASKEARERFRSELDRKMGGIDNAYSTLILDDGADGKVIGANMEQLDFAITQAAGENRIATAAGVPPIVIGIKEGLAAATYSNYGQALRAFADLTVSPKWGETAEQLESIVDVPGGARLWFDSTRVAALQQDSKDQAEIDGITSRTIRTLVDAGYTADSVSDAVASSEFSLLEHTGTFSVQLQPPGTMPADTDGDE